MKIGFVASAFDLLHAGHLLMLEDAKTQCDYLKVGLHINPSKERPNSKRTPIESVFERYLRLKACKYVDEIIPYETEEELETILSTQKIDVRIIGMDYMDIDFTGSDIVEEIYYHDRYAHDFSTTNLIKKILEQG